MAEHSLSFTHSLELELSTDCLFLEPKARVKGDLWAFERHYLARGFLTIAGVDEAGRGPLAGPVVAACAHIPPSFDSSGINDSKKLTPKTRNILYQRIVDSAVSFSIGIVDAEEIDRINILKATHLAMQRAVTGLEFVPDVLLIDGLPVPTMCNSTHRAIVGGDGLSISIATASVIAKVTRDQIMCQFAETYPEYGFESHKGYGSKRHLSALAAHGPCPIHRLSFSPIAKSSQTSLI